jgi:hypothetical protein
LLLLLPFPADQSGHCFFRFAWDLRFRLDVAVVLFGFASANSVSPNFAVRIPNALPASSRTATRRDPAPLATTRVRSSKCLDSTDCISPRRMICQHYDSQKYQLTPPLRTQQRPLWQMADGLCVGQHVPDPQSVPS